LEDSRRAPSPVPKDQEIEEKLLEIPLLTQSSFTSFKKQQYNPCVGGCKSNGLSCCGEEDFKFAAQHNNFKSITTPVSLSEQTSSVSINYDFDEQQDPLLLPNPNC
jgi:hypothetical protein